MYKATLVTRKGEVKEVECEQIQAGNGVIMLMKSSSVSKVDEVYLFPLDTVAQCHGKFINEPEIIR